MNPIYSVELDDSGNIMITSSSSGSLGPSPPRPRLHAITNSSSLVAWLVILKLKRNLSIVITHVWQNWRLHWLRYAHLQLHPLKAHSLTINCRLDSIAIFILCDALSTKEPQGSRVTWGWGWVCTSLVDTLDVCVLIKQIPPGLFRRDQCWLRYGV